MTSFLDASPTVVAADDGSWTGITAIRCPCVNDGAAVGVCARRGETPWPICPYSREQDIKTRTAGVKGGAEIHVHLREMR